MDTDRLIADLAGRAGPVRLLRPPMTRAAAWAALALPAALAGALLIGVRADVGARLGATPFQMVMAFGLATALASGAAAAALAVPGRLEEGPARWMPTALLTAWIGSLLWLLSAEGWAIATSPGWPAPGCIAKVVALGALPAAGAFLLVRRGAPTRAGQAAWMAGVSGLAVGAAALPLVCPIDAAAHQLAMHVLPVPVLGVGLALAGYAWLSARRP